MTKLWTAGRPIQVTTDQTGRPARLRWRGRWETIETVGTRWRIADEWWRRPIHRDYFQIATPTLIGVIYQDRLTKDWYLERIYD